MIARQYRGDLMRQDDRDARLGTQDNYYFLGMDYDRMGRNALGDRMMAECVRNNTRAAPDRPTAPASTR